ncbi:MAG: polysaccharide deacetylase family protein [Tannerella sp.]|jgi:peptidoglycan/xylan/chitin deacetylase (PgdA/CDA1 family)|nr:polysaccharide deacetylase family protein [Tannerella sp.]
MSYILATVLIIIASIIYILKRTAQKNGVRIFMYHHIGEINDGNPSSYYVDERMFSLHLDLITEKYCPISLSELEESCEQGRKLPSGAVLLTFDDGYRNNYTYAFRAAAAKKVPITLFLSTGEIDRKDDMLTWEQVKEMQASGWVSFASHGVRHLRLRELSDEEVMRELAASKREVEEQTGKAVKSFCYPYGAFDRRTRRLVFKAGYVMDFGTRKGINTWMWKARRPLLRAHVMRGETVKDFQNQLKTGYKRGLPVWLFR